MRINKYANQYSDIQHDPPSQIVEPFQLLPEGDVSLCAPSAQSMNICKMEHKKIMERIKQA